MKSVFVETGNVTAFRRAVLTVEDVQRGQPGIVVAWGQAGRGKTFTARNSYTERGGVFLSAWEGMTQAAFLGRLCKETTGANTTPRSAHACKVRIIETLEKRRDQGQTVTIYMDEADRLHFGRIEDLRDIHEATGAAVVLIGEEELIGLLSERRRIWRAIRSAKPGFSWTDIAQVSRVSYTHTRKYGQWLLDEAFVERHGRKGATYLFRATLRAKDTVETPYPPQDVTDPFEVERNAACRLVRSFMERDPYQPAVRGKIIDNCRAILARFEKEEQEQ
ncbi:ATP-binding protein [Desulfovibrio sp. TomC]|uniref:ATP-binding protein n=1 Tax=Desulfovibrio sp. TomC TaxID=1562888 RepID=UPI0005748A75|nr:ATP-binding protein [Desulfovibrio sp. TomC]KHK02798.1 putative bacteriophage DNA transposition B protein [Desulfovibrio sp. TomC]